MGKDREQGVFFIGSGIPEGHPLLQERIDMPFKYIKAIVKILKQNNRSVTGMNDLQYALHEELTKLGYLEREVPCNAPVKAHFYSCTPKGAAAFVNRYNTASFITATEGFIAELNTPPRMTATHLESLLFLIEKGPVDDGDVPSKSTRDDLVEWGYAARVRVRNQDGFNAATYKGRNAFCEFYGVETMNEAYERRLIAKVQNSAKAASDGT